MISTNPLRTWEFDRKYLFLLWVCVVGDKILEQDGDDLKIGINPLGPTMLHASEIFLNHGCFFCPLNQHPMTSVISCFLQFLLLTGPSI